MARLSPNVEILQSAARAITTLLAEDGSPGTPDHGGVPSRPLRRKATLVNQYTGITECYDPLMRAGYYDHDTIADAADAVMGDRMKVLELGVGTGPFAQSLAATRPDGEITGVDFTPSMLEVARDRVGDDARLIEAGVISMDLDETFDTAISSGGVWVIIEAGDGSRLDVLEGLHER